MSIKIQHLCKNFGDQKAVNDISLEIGKGSVVGFLGPNGAGKSTTMKMLSTYLAPSSGQAWICGIDVQADPIQVRKKLGYLPESNPLYYDMYVREYLEFAASIHQLGKKSHARIEEMIARTGLQKEAKKKIGNLSKGYKQRVGIAQAMIHDPEVLILDEPTSGLDPNQIKDIRDLIIELGQEKTVLLSTHIMQEVKAMCARIVIINNGSIVADDSLEQIEAMAERPGAKDLILELDRQVSREQLLSLAYVSNARPLEGRKWQLASSDIDALRKTLLSWAVENDFSILTLQSTSQSLEEVFHQLTRGKEDAGAAAQ